MERLGQARRQVVVVGGGTAGWMTAAALVGLGSHACTVRLIESSDIPIVGVGEATLPHLRAFLDRLGIEEAAFMVATRATFKLGIAFQGFGSVDAHYFHPFGNYGADWAGVGFHHHWLRAHAAGDPHLLDQYGVADMAAAACRFAHPAAEAGGPAFGYAYQFDATRLGPFLRDWAQARGATRTEGEIVNAERGADGDVRALRLADGRRIKGDLFIDCSGFRALLGDRSEWEDWSHWLPCDRAVAVPCAAPFGPVEPFTRAQAMAPGGWRWRIPLRHRIGNGYVYASAFTGDAAAADALLAGLEGEPLADPRVLRFRAGRQRRSWVRNVVAVGLASGFLEPLESTSIYLVQAAITQLIERFPGSEITDADRRGFNAAIDAEYDRIRDFLILHYHATTRSDSAFWDHVRTMAVPDSLAAKLELWRETAQIAEYGFGLFLSPSWLAVLVGQGVLPRRWDARANLSSLAETAHKLSRMRDEVAARVAAMPDHAAALPASAGKA